MRLLLIALMALTTCCTCAAVQFDGDVPKLIRRLAEYAALAQFEKAVEELSHVKSVEGLKREHQFDLIFELTKLQSSMLRGGKVEKALIVSRRAREIFPNEMLTGLDLGGLLVTTGRYKEAIPILKEALGQRGDLREVKPIDKMAGYINLGKALLLTGQPEAAKAPLYKAVALGQEQAGAIYLLGQAYILLKEDQNALRNLNRAFKMAPEEAQEQDLINLAGLLFDNGRFDDTVKVCRYGIERFPAVEGLHFHWAQCLKRAGKKAQAFYMYQHELLLSSQKSDFTAATFRELRDLTRQVHANPKTPEHRQIVLCVLGIQETKSRPPQYEKAVKHFKMAIEENTEEVALLHLFLGEAYAGQKKYADAIREFRKATVIDPYFAPAYVELGDLLAKDGQARAALRAWRKAVALDPKNWKVRSLLERARKKNKEKKKASDLSPQAQ